VDIRNDAVDAIGRTPLIRLKRASEATGCTILGKAEFMNPGQSVKDRPGRQMILEAEARKEIEPGGLVVEATAGNTGIGLALVANARGYRTLIVIPETQSREKKDVLRLLGAQLMEVPAAPYANANNYQHIGRRTAEALRANEPHGVFFADQWNNLDNRKAHYVSTGPEIWEQTAGEVDGFICSIGTGGTVAGVSEYLRERKPGVRDRHRRSARRGDVQPVLQRRGQGLTGRLDHRRHRTGPRDAHHQGHQGGQPVRGAR
jgi:cysteine synthase A